jgi:hypothetical protein
MFVVTGTYLGAMYQATWTEQDADESHLCVESTHSMIRPLLDAYTGDTFGATPTGPFLTLDVADGASVLAALGNLTTVTDVSGDVPTVPGATEAMEGLVS